MTERLLSQLRIWNTRPKHQAVGLSRLLSHQGATVIDQPLLSISWPPLCAELQCQLFELSSVDWLIFVSQNAVGGLAYLLNQSARPWPTSPRYACVGKQTALALSSRYKGDILFPTDEASSEALLALPDMNSIQGKSIAIVCGNHGRELLYDTLQVRGARVSSLKVYQRQPLRLAQFPVCDATVVTSEMAVQALLACPDVDKSLPVVTVSQRLVDVLYEHGFSRVMVARRPYDEDVLEAVVNLF